MTLARTLVGKLILALALIAVTLAQGYARGLPPAGPTFEMVICAEDGVQVILVDAEGMPVGSEPCHPGPCQTCIAPAAFGLADSAVTVTPPVHIAETPLPPDAPVFCARHHSPCLPRGPPTKA